MPYMMDLMIIVVGSRADVWGPRKLKQRYVDPMWEQRVGGYARGPFSEHDQRVLADPPLKGTDKQSAGDSGLDINREEPVGKQSL